MPVSKERFMMCVKGLPTMSMVSLNNFVDIPSCPQMVLYGVVFYMLQWAEETRGVVEVVMVARLIIIPSVPGPWISASTSQATDDHMIPVLDEHVGVITVSGKDKLIGILY